MEVERAFQGGNKGGYNVVVAASEKNVYIHGGQNDNIPRTTYRLKIPLKVSASLKSVQVRSIVS
jgi:hypothetical protein